MAAVRAPGNPRHPKRLPPDQHLLPHLRAFALVCRICPLSQKENLRDAGSSRQLWACRVLAAISAAQLGSHRSVPAMTLPPIAVFLCSILPPCVAAEAIASAPASMPLDQILRHMEQHELAMSSSLVRYTCLRRYSLENRRFHRK